MCSLLPTLEFSTGQRADGRLALEPQVQGGEVSVRGPAPRGAEGWPGGGWVKGTRLGLRSTTFPVAVMGSGFEKVSVELRGEIGKVST